MKAFTTKFSITINDKYDVMLMQTFSILRIQLQGGLVQPGHWNYFNLVCSEESL